MTGNNYNKRDATADRGLSTPENAQRRAAYLLRLQAIRARNTPPLPPLRASTPRPIPALARPDEPTIAVDLRALSVLAHAHPCVLPTRERPARERMAWRRRASPPPSAFVGDLGLMVLCVLLLGVGVVLGVTALGWLIGLVAP